MKQHLLNSSGHRPSWYFRTAITVMVMGLVPLTAARAFPTLDFREVLTQNGAFRQVSDPSIPWLLPSGDPAGLGFRVQVDFQGNGRPDTFLCRYGEENAPIPCRALRPNVDGSLTDVTRKLFGNGTLPSVVFANPIIVGDFNNDARPDLYFANWGYDFPPFSGERGALFNSSADGSYVDRSSTLPQGMSNVYGACSGDVDGDGVPDVYVLNFKSAGLEGSYLLIGKGDGTFTQSTRGIPAELLGVNKGYSMGTCAIADVDRDGYADLILLTLGDIHSENLVLFNDGTGDFTRRPRQVLPAGSLKPGDWEFNGIVVLDINRDGYPDLVVYADRKPIYDGAAFQILINRGDGTFADETAIRLLGPNTYAGYTTIPSGCSPLRFADFNGDGWEDLYCNPIGALDIRVPPIWMNDGSGRFTPAQLGVLGPTSSFGAVTAGAVTDFDRDGQLDVVVLFGTAPESGNIWYRTYRNHMARTVPSEPFISKAEAGDARASISFTPPLAGGASPITGYAATCTQGTRPGTFISSGPASPLTVTGLNNGKPYLCSVTASSAAGTSLPSKSVSVRPLAISVDKSSAIEFYHATFDHYFITPVAGEIALLDAHAPPFQEWSRTGLSFNVYAPATAPTGSVATCRFFNTSFAPKSSHFYAPKGFGCEATIAGFPDWGLEDDNLFYTMLPNANGACPTGTIPVYRLYNNGMGGAPNHRFTTDLAVRNQMLAQGYVAEGYGIGVSMCSPQ
ncbi:MAG: FG-GAP-like repeat-containing protein [Gemmatimonadaceae bacterium]